jgi:hypothetical protein
MQSCTSKLFLLLSVASSSVCLAGEDKQLHLTIYNDDLALIEHTRPMTVPAGRQRIEFKGVSAGIIPQTVGFRSGQLELLEQNFDYDLLTPSKMLDKAVGQKIKLIRTNPATGAQTEEPAEVLSATEGVVLKIGDRIEVLRDDGLPTRVIFDRIPDNLRASPTLSVLVDAKKPVKEDITLAYLSHGFSWKSDYVAVFDEPKGEMALQGWITLQNSSGTSFENANVQLVAGDMHVVANESEWWSRYRPHQATNVRRAGTEAAPTQQQLGDYYIYPIAEATTVANNQTKQVSFLTADKVRASKVYEVAFRYFESLDTPVSADVRVRFSNSGAAGLGRQLPSGVVRVYARDARGQPQFLGEDRIDHTSAGSDIAIKTGEAFDVTVQPTLVDSRPLTKRRTLYKMTYKVNNARSAAAVVTVRMDGLWRFNNVVEESLKGRRIDSNSLAWDVPVAANGTTEFTVQVENGW